MKLDNCPPPNSPPWPFLDDAILIESALPSYTLPILATASANIISAAIAASTSK
jgi:hypothetical protein